MRFLARSLTGLFLAALTLGLLALAASMIAGAVSDRLSTDRPGQPARERVFSANVMTVTPRIVVPQTVAFGEIRSRRTLELRAPRGGRVLEIAPGVEDGATVTEGQVLVRLDPVDATSARDLAQAGLRDAEAEGRDAERGLVLARDDLAAAQAQASLRGQALTRQEDLQRRGVGSPAAVETAALALSSAEQAVLSRRSALAQAEARVDQAISSLSRAGIALAEAERALADTEIRASFTGRLNGVTVVAGGLVGANERLAELIDPDRLEVSFRLSTAQFSRLLDAQGGLISAPVTVSLDVLGAEIVAIGRVERVGAAVGEGATGRLIYASLDSARGFRPGDFVTVTIAEPEVEGMALLPATAVDSRGGVLLVGADNRLEAQVVPVLRRQGDDVIVDVRAIAGREVVLERSPLLGAGIRINPIRPGASAATVAPAQVAETVVLTPERRAGLIALVEGNNRMPEEAKARMLEQLAQDQVPAQVVARLESRMGG
ncbi:MAG: HlyD family efflux transporter periplasmic adaptor subunit [Pseudotabrizicola sp.]|uniref:efflux RND transporter periplasmic adaptor subunit n=1 Tax=Pseudotabrizicola sp. TaxID=2939647 RepID=UPI0027316F64|nr:HlyD family efflux transporter periplasmic adaptor subunit [Pseudotabrizicola sp.]MDP2079933.1 HlyD family efflux transporter periplasmic adaptor subunit [Pseudotabrizicola sp.]MDZ7575672.1 HlyD family efflux transporter periplasmic adaptor subunit [Pseudotabrizicola sp.]